MCINTKTALQAVFVLWFFNLCFRKTTYSKFLRPFLCVDLRLDSLLFLQSVFPTVDPHFLLFYYSPFLVQVILVIFLKVVSKLVLLFLF